MLFRSAALPAARHASALRWGEEEHQPEQAAGQRALAAAGRTMPMLKCRPLDERWSELIERAETNR